MDWKGAAAVAAALALAVGGCGGSSTLSKAEFVKRAEAVCVRLRNEGFALLKTAESQRKAQHLSEAQVKARLAPKVAAVEARQLRNLAALNPPSELQTTYVQWRRVLGAMLSVGVHPRVSAAEEAKRVAESEQRERLRSKLGIRQC
jgi:hypothetical protein